jgi:hypothetical protein
MRTNKTAQAINRAITQPSNTIVVPRKLATTMGYELTYMPGMFDHLWTVTKGRMKGWAQYEYVNDTLRNGMRQCAYVMHSTKDKDGDDVCGSAYVHRYVSEFKLDPQVVEVTTQPTNSGPHIKKAIALCAKYADAVNLVPRTLYSRGGGAHLHTGIPYQRYVNRERYGRTTMEWRKYCGAMQYIAYTNPWLAWAFANPLDSKNAQQLTKLNECEDAPNHARYMQRAYRNIKDAHEYYTSYRDSFMQYEQKLHDLAYRKNRYAIRDVIDMHDYYRRNMIAQKLELHKLCAKLLKDMDDDLTWAIEQMYNESSEQRVSLDTITAIESKAACVTQRNYGPNGTFEFRCFMMYEHHSEHAKQIVLANAIVQHAMRMVESDTQVNPNVIAPTLATMKYSDAKRAFCNMLREYDLHPDYFREECVNIALRKRAIRNRKISI